MSSQTLILVPTYNEADNIAAIVDSITANAPECDILVIDDNSPDGTGDEAERLAAADQRVSVLHRESKQGLGRAYLAGFAVALERGYDFVVEIDADGSHDPADLPRLRAAAQQGAELVIGSRWAPGGSIANWHASRQAISRIGNAYARWMLRSGIRDLTAGYRVFSRSVLEALLADTSISSQGYCFQVEMASRAERAGFAVTEVPVVFTDRQRGRSKMHVGIVAEALWRVTLWGAALRLRPRRRR